jgi:hypothetical protein
MHIALNCELEDSRTEIALDLDWDERPPRETNRTGRVRLRLPDWNVDGGFRIDRDILRSFLSQARRMWRELEGSATLHDWGSISELTLKVLDRGRGTVAVGARLSRYISPARGTPDSADFPFGRELMITLGGLTIDQSYLPPLLDDVRDFLALADADLEQAAPTAAPASGARPACMIVITAADCPVPKALRLLLEGARKHGIALGERCLLFSASRLTSAAMRGSPGTVGYIRKKGVTFAQTASDWQGLPELFGLMASGPARGCAGMIFGDKEFGAAEAPEAAALVRRPGGLSEFLLTMRGLDRGRDALRRARLAAFGRTAVVLDRSGTLLEVALHPVDERGFQRLANAASDMGLRVDLRTETWGPVR